MFAALAVLSFRRLGIAAGAYVGAVVGVSVVLAPESAGRQLLAAIPAFAVVGFLDHGGGFGEALRMLSFALLGIMLFAFVTGHFVG